MAPNRQTDANIKVSRDNYDPPVLTGVTKLKRPFADRLIQLSLATNTFNNLDLHVDPSLGMSTFTRVEKLILLFER